MMGFDEQKSLTKPEWINQATISDNRFIELLDASERPVLSDGAMGTMLNASGTSFDQCFDALNLSKPDLVAGIHEAYIDAGAEIIQTNTFGANRYKLSAHDLGEQVAEINRAGANIARRAVIASHKNVLIAGDVGPFFQSL